MTLLKYFIKIKISVLALNFDTKSLHYYFISGIIHLCHLPIAKVEFGQYMSYSSRRECLEIRFELLHDILAVIVIHKSIKRNRVGYSTLF